MAKIGVFFGGGSNEHEISVITGMLCVNLLRGAGRDVLPVYLTRDNRMLTGEMQSVAAFENPSKKWRTLTFCEGGLARGGHRYPLEVALNCCHGGFGEDGTLAALFKWYRIPSASPDVAVSSVFMDKTLTKLAARGLGLPVLEGVTVREKEISPPFPFPVIVKPAKLGSSIGIRVARDEKELEAALALALHLDDSVLIEPYAEGKRDLNCAVCRIGGKIRVSPVEEVFSSDEILSFREKYEGTETRSRLPADIPDEIAKKVQIYAETLYSAFAGRGVVRADFLLVGDTVYFNELNTVPGSLAYYLFGDSLTEGRDFLQALLEEGKRIAPDKPILTTGILSRPVFTGKGGKERIR